MSNVRVACFAVSLDGYGAGPDQSREHPLGVGGLGLHEWSHATRTFRAMFGMEGGSTGVDDSAIERGFRGVGAWILGRNMFGPVRGEWTPEWRGWWGENPPYHVPVFVLTHYPRAPIVMDGGTTFHFVTGGIHRALDLAREAAAGEDVRIGGGVATVRAYLQARLIDELHLVIAPVLLGRGESLFDALDLVELGYRCTEHRPSERVTHVRLERAA
ncbi:MAG: dihydrofolate reductase family protein [Burkholderiales bacterium]